MRFHRTHAAAQFVLLGTATAALFLLAPPSVARGDTGGGRREKPEPSRARNDSAQLVPGIPRDRMIAPASLYAALAAVHRRIPSFSRQTKLALQRLSLSLSSTHALRTVVQTERLHLDRPRNDWPAIGHRQ